MARTKEFDEKAVLNKAVDLFWMKGYHATSAQDLVDGLGISRSSLYDTYSDKHSLFVKALQQYRKERIDEVIQTLNKTEDAEEYIKYLFNYIKTEAIEDKVCKGCFMVNSTIELAPVDKEIAVIVNSIMQDFEDALCKAVRKGQDAGVFTTKHSARSLARFLYNSINGLRVTVKSGAGKKVFDDIVNVSLSVLKQ
ncbi:MAG: TetR/AcrR family transcriptional regulator [Chitinophagaceae bacterium]